MTVLLTIQDCETSAGYRELVAGDNVSIEEVDGQVVVSAVAGEGGQAFPVGAVYFNITGTNPNTELGYGTWSQIAQGQFIVGQSSGDGDFDTAEETGGSKTHTHDTHDTTANLRTGGGGIGFTADGSHVAASNVPPYCVLYVWKRTV